MSDMFFIFMTLIYSLDSFATTGQHIYVIQSGRKGPTTLVKWSLIPFYSENGDSKYANDGDDDKRMMIEAEPIDLMICCPVPATRLKLSCDGDQLAVGGCDGSVTIISENTMKKLSSAQCHDLPGFCYKCHYTCSKVVHIFFLLKVTGMAFAPVSVSEANGEKK